MITESAQIACANFSITYGHTYMHAYVELLKCNGAEQFYEHVIKTM
jgi:hypothetical protein